jgi:hypothetical protein
VRGLAGGEHGVHGVILIIGWAGRRFLLSVGDADGDVEGFRSGLPERVVRGTKAAVPMA